MTKTQLQLGLHFAHGEQNDTDVCKSLGKNMIRECISPRRSGNPRQATHSKRSLPQPCPISPQQLEASTLTLNAQHTRNVYKKPVSHRRWGIPFMRTRRKRFFDDLGGDVKLRVDLYILWRLIKGPDRGLHELHIKAVDERSSGLFYRPSWSSAGVTNG